MCFFSRLTFRQKSLLHPILFAVFKINAVLNGFRFRILKDQRRPTDRPIIFAVTHTGKFDIEILSAAVKDHMYLLTGDYERIQGTFYSPLLALNGVFYVNKADRNDGVLVKEKMVKHLQAGGNIMYYPEGNWNISVNLPVQPCFWGIADVARRGNAVIVPIAMERYDKHYDINIGENIDLNNSPYLKYDRTESVNMLRDALATLKWEIWEHHKMSYGQACKIDWDSIIDARLAEWPHFDRAAVNRMLLKPKNIIAPENAFAHLQNLNPCRENAFLFSRRYYHAGKQ